MSTIGIIAEFNPLHTGHKHLLNYAKSQGNVVCVISGNFVQRGDTAILEKRKRAEAALRCGADVVLEIPVYWSMSTAQNFALAGVSILSDFGCDKIVFGSECGDIEKLKSAANILSTDNYSAKLSSYLKSGITFASARDKAARECGIDEDLLNSPNNNLGVEYIAAANAIGSNIEFETIKRIGANHESEIITSGIASSSKIRNLLYKGEFLKALELIPKQAHNFSKDDISDIKRLETAILFALRNKNKEDFSRLPDLSEGIENKIYSESRLATSLEELYNNIKVKRYTLSRIRRLVLSTFLNETDQFFMKKPPYIRVLGFNKAGENLIKKQTKLSPVPIITKAKEIENLSDDSKIIFELESRATDIYTLSLSKPLPCGIEYTSKLIKTE